MRVFFQEGIAASEPYSEALQKLTPICDCPVFLFVCTGFSIDRGLVDQIFLGKQKIFGGSHDAMSVLLDADGGDIAAAYKLIHLLRGVAKKVTIYVPRRAKSAATFLCLGADEIVMSEHAELGPLDVQFLDVATGKQE